MTAVRTPDVLVLGAGASGVSAAVAAAEHGADVLLLERYGFAGGMATTAQVGTVCGHYLRNTGDEFVEVHQGFPSRFVHALQEVGGSTPMQYKEGLRFLPYDPFAFRIVCDRFLDQPTITTLFHTTLFQAGQSENKVHRVTALFRGQTLTVEPGAVVDCSGDAVLASCLQRPFLESEPHQAGAFVFALTGLPEGTPDSIPLQFLQDVARGMQAGALPDHCDRASIVPGSIRGTEASVKLGLPEAMTPDPEQSSRLEVEARQRTAAIVDYLATRTETFAGVRLTGAAAQVGVRTGPRAKGRIVLTRDDVLACRKPADGIAAGAWPLEFWGHERGPTLTTFPDNDVYLIPAGCLRDTDLQNLFMAGRHISADESAISSARVIGTCLATGWAAGSIASAQVSGASIESSVATVQKDLGITHWAGTS